MCDAISQPSHTVAAHLKDATAIEHGASLGCEIELFATDEGEASGEVSDESNHDCVNSNSDSDTEYSALGWGI